MKTASRVADQATNPRPSTGELDTYRAVMDSLYDGVYFVGLDRTIEYWNHSAERLSGYPAQCVIGHRCMDNILDHVDEDGERLCVSRCPLQASMEDGELREAKVYLRHRDGHRVAVLVRTAPIRDRAGSIVGGVEIFNTDTRLLAAMDGVDELRRQAMRDPLTGLGNRRFLELSLEVKKAEMERYQAPFSVAMVDIDHFKRFNDTWGHDVGDLALATVARTLMARARAADVVTRWGCEEFVILLGHAGAEEARLAADRLRSLVGESRVRTASGDLRVTVSVGCAVARPGESQEELLKRADEALYRAKERGRDQVVIDP